MYPKIIFKHFQKPKNLGEIKDADGIGKEGNPMCGDIMWFYIKVDKRNKDVLKQKIINIKFQTLGCVVAIALSSILTEMVKKKTIEEVLKINQNDILKKIEVDLPHNKIHCSFLADKALKNALYNYFEKIGYKVEIKLR